MTGISIGPKKDNWLNFVYDERILDALASLFHVSSKCTATLIYKDKLYLSYSNKVFLPESLRPLVKKEIIDSKKRLMVEFQVNEIFDSIYNNKPDKALALYLLLNQNFIDIVERVKKTIIDFNIKNLKQQKSISEKFSNLISDSIYHQLPEYKTKIIEQDIVFSQEHAFLLEALNLFILNGKGFRKQCSKAKLPDTYELLVQNYEDIIIGFRGCKDLINSTEEQIIEIKEQLIRPKQDVQKIFYYIPKYGIKGYEILSNMEGLHAEVNLALHFPDTSLLESNYIGTSKLCCGFCYEFLGRKGYAHRGTHSVCDPEWKMYLSPQTDEFVRQVAPNLNMLDEDTSESEISSNYPNQWRRLSTDNFEKELLELHQLKTELGLNRYCSSALSDFFDSLGSSINYCCSKFANIISGQYTEISDPSPSEHNLIGASEA